MQQEDSDDEDDLDDDALSDWNLSKLSSLHIFLMIAGVFHFRCSLLCCKKCYKVVNVAIQFTGQTRNRYYQKKVSPHQS